MNLRSMALLISLAAANALAQVPSAIAGDYVEARSNHVYTCACLCSGELVTGGREAILAWQIRDGSFRGTPLAGVRAVAVVVADSNLSDAAASRRSVLYVDASDEQKQAVAELITREYGKAVGEIVAVHRTPIGFQRLGETVNLTVGDIIRLDIRKARLPEDAHPGSIVWYDPFIPVRDAVLGTTTYYKYWGEDFARRWWEVEPGITGYLGSFVLRAT